MSRRVLFSVVTPLVYRLWVFSVVGFVTEGFGWLVSTGAGQPYKEAPAPYWVLAPCKSLRRAI